MEFKAFKMDGLGNDFVIIDQRNDHIELTNDPMESINDADVVMTDTFVSIHNNETDRLKKFLPKFQVNNSLMQKAKKRRNILALSSC